MRVGVCCLDSGIIEGHVQHLIKFMGNKMYFLKIIYIIKGSYSLGFNSEPFLRVRSLDYISQRTFDLAEKRQ